MGNAKLVSATTRGSGDAKINLGKLVPDWYKLASSSDNQWTGTPPPSPPSRSESSLEGK